MFYGKNKNNRASSLNWSPGCPWVKTNKVFNFFNTHYVQFVKLGIFSLENWEFWRVFPNWERFVYRTQFIEIDGPALWQSKELLHCTIGPLWLVLTLTLLELFFWLSRRISIQFLSAISDWFMLPITHKENIEDQLIKTDKNIKSE